jgi:hypothetical protein
MRVTVALQDKLVAKANKLLRKKTLSGLLNSCLADWIAQMSKKLLEARLTEKYRRSKTGRRRVSRDFTAVDKQGLPSSRKEEKEFIRNLMEKGTMKGKRKWKREDLYER